jgi:hypothetical protein
MNRFAFLLYTILAAFAMPTTNGFMIAGRFTPTLCSTPTLPPIPSSCNRNNKNTPATTTSSLSLSSSENNDNNKLLFLLDPGTKGGAVFLSLILFLVPWTGYNVVVAAGVDPIVAGRWFGVGVTVALSVAWVSTYIFRVATKDMTYVSLQSVAESETEMCCPRCSFLCRASNYLW